MESDIFYPKIWNSYIRKYSNFTDPWSETFCNNSKMISSTCKTPEIPVFLVSIDPGVVNLGVSILYFNGNAFSSSHKPVILSYSIWDIKTDVASNLHNKPPSEDKMNKVFNWIYQELVVYSKKFINPIYKWLIEYQPPINFMNNPGLIRYNTFIEAFFFGLIYRIPNMTIDRVHPSSVKKFLCFDKADYNSNKSQSVKIASSFLGNSIGSLYIHHIADTVINSYYWFATQYDFGDENIDKIVYNFN